MIWGEEKRLCLLYALTPIHAGAGQALKAVDLPIQRERHTAWPMVQASGIKGALRDWCEKVWKKMGLRKDLADCIFGKAGEEASWAGAVTVTDARILFFPVRSNVVPFVHVTSPAVLKRFAEDLTLLGLENSLGQKEVQEDQFIPLTGSFPDEIVLEDLVAKKAQDSSLDDKNWLNKNLPELQKAVLISDEVFGYLVRTATEVQAHITIDDATGTAKEGSLRYQEYLPADSVLYFLSFFAEDRKPDSSCKEGGLRLLPRDVASLVIDAVATHIQIGGDFTLGKGICKVYWIAPDASSGGAS
ncbi:type III-B CRISPR module RAMP protein Cmr4 [Thermosulfurimonas sp. F29]|uniref:type III-B CRISPR module RAMP protein Cmr4 n=1 Tax=Thermosulfurimonas sp. F29 TaxID=2867247 RepID=UPI001C82E973|nr:type III-B CRISPR module RAMP protein Cmr4 [Thermosulfurimonas sp. F29]MBX6423230.1 type III-B CRISPR module RAMP protein Cmr4 [Thermosulfurimonas sp. F29]